MYEHSLFNGYKTWTRLKHWSGSENYKAGSAGGPWPTQWFLPLKNSNRAIHTRRPVSNAYNRHQTSFSFSNNCCWHCLYLFVIAVVVVGGLGFRIRLLSHHGPCKVAPMTFIYDRHSWQHVYWRNVYSCTLAHLWVIEFSFLWSLMQCFCHTCYLGEEHTELNKALVSLWL